MNIREFNEETDHDYNAGVAIWNANWPDYLETIDQWKAWHATRNPEYFYQRLIGEENGQVVCFAQWGAAGWSDFAGKHFVDFDVKPDADFEATTTQIYDYMIAEMAARNPTKVSHFTRSDQADKIAFLKKRGYTLVQTEPTSLLDVTAFDASPFQGAVDKAYTAGLKMYSYTQLKEMDPQWKRKLYDLIWEIFQDIPMSDPPKREKFEVFSNRIDDPIATPLDNRYVAVDTTTANGDDLGAYAAISNLDYNIVDKTRAHTGLTGVARAYRRKGLATATKVHAISRAKADGIEVIDTDNDENNPMLDLNIRLGFKPGPAWVDYELVIE